MRYFLRQYPLKSITSFIYSRPPAGDYTASGLLSVTDQVYINVYDEFESDIGESAPAARAGEAASKEIRKLVEKRLLGTIAIPFSTIYLNGIYHLFERYCVWLELYSLSLIN